MKIDRLTIIKNISNITVDIQPSLTKFIKIIKNFDIIDRILSNVALV